MPKSTTVIYEFDVLKLVGTLSPTMVKSHGARNQYPLVFPEYEVVGDGIGIMVCAETSLIIKMLDSANRIEMLNNFFIVFFFSCSLICLRIFYFMRLYLSVAT